MNPVAAAVLGLLGWNYSRHRRGLQTFCAWFRAHVPRWAVIPIWSAITAYMIPHLWRGYARRTKESR